MTSVPTTKPPAVTDEALVIRGCSVVYDSGNCGIALQDPGHITIRLLGPLLHPIEGLNGNVVWPYGWSEEHRREWRRQRFCNGAEWELRGPKDLGKIW